MRKLLNPVALFVLAFLLSLPGAIAAQQKSAAPEKAAPQRSGAATAHKVAIPADRSVELHRGWALQSSCNVKATGDAISRSGFAIKGWHHAEVPTTVVGALITDGTYKDPYYGMNLRSLPGMDYSSKHFFSDQDMPAGSPYRCSWWFRTEFATPVGQTTIWLDFKGINYRANIWINGHQLANAKDVAGMNRAWEFDISELAAHGKPNALAVEVFAPEKNDLALTWVDWNPTPPDKDMGLWKEVFLRTSGRVAVRNSYVTSKLGDNYTTAALTASAELHNATDQAVKGTLHAKIGDINISQPVELAPSETRTVTFAPEQFAALNLKNPRLWWPYQMGKPELYSGQFSFETGGKISDVQTVRFGIREVTAEITKGGGSIEYETNSRTEPLRKGMATGSLLFRVNGKRVLIRGGGWAPDMFLRWPTERYRDQFNVTKGMGLNAIRLEGRMETDEFFDLADEMGLLIMPGWTCCDMWEHWKDWTPETYKIAGASLKHELDRLRNHPSVYVWLYGSDNPPPEDVEKMYLQIIKDERWPNPTISSASQTPTAITGPSGVKMTGPYEYVPANYWLTDTQAGGAHGYNTETSPGPAIPPLESLKRFIPKDHLWPIDDYWNYHAGLERFTNIDIFRNAIEKRYGPAQNLTDFLRKSQAQTYEGERGMFEAYARNKYDSTGVIQWMLNNGWPSLIWHLYDYYLVPAGGYFGTKKATEPLHVQYSYDDHSVAVINGYYTPQPGMHVTAKLYDINAKEIGSKDATLDLAADSSTKAFELPKPPESDKPQTYFVRLDLRDARGKLVSDNFYWLSSKPDVIDFAARTDTDYTPQKDFTDFTALNSLPLVKLSVRQRSESKKGEGSIRVTLHNPGKAIAFMVHTRLTRGKSDDDVVPIFWDDNYVSLLPGETRELTAHYDPSALAGKSPELVVDGWNVATTSPRSHGVTEKTAKK